jgi:hypothetical protein
LGRCLSYSCGYDFITPRSGFSIPSTPKVLTLQTCVWIAAALTAVAVVIYSNFLTNGFILDSFFILLHDPRIQKINRDNLMLILTKEYRSRPSIRASPGPLRR